MAMIGELKDAESDDPKSTFDSLTLVNRVSMISRPVTTYDNRF